MERKGERVSVNYLICIVFVVSLIPYVLQGNIHPTDEQNIQVRDTSENVASATTDLLAEYEESLFDVTKAYKLSSTDSFNESEDDILLVEEWMFEIHDNSNASTYETVNQNADVDMILEEWMSMPETWTYHK